MRPRQPELGLPVPSGRSHGQDLPAGHRCYRSSTIRTDTEGAEEAFGLVSEARLTRDRKGRAVYLRERAEGILLTRSTEFLVDQPLERGCLELGDHQGIELYVALKLRIAECRTVPHLNVCRSYPERCSLPRLPSLDPREDSRPATRAPHLRHREQWTLVVIRTLPGGDATVSMLSMRAFTRWANKLPVFTNAQISCSPFRSKPGSPHPVLRANASRR